MEQSSPLAKEGYGKEMQELVELAQKSDLDAAKMEQFLRVRALLQAFRPGADKMFEGLFERDRHERDVHVLLGRMREELLTYSKETRECAPTNEERKLLLEISAVPGFGVVRKLVMDFFKDENSVPVTERVIREIPEPEKGDTRPICGCELDH